jgi:ABC-type multidrug transport system fused ATPase/permease subunit
MAKLMFEQVRLRLRFVRYQQGLGLMAATISGVAMFLALWWGFELARKGPAAGGISLGTAIAFAEIIRQFFMPVQALTNRLTAIQAVIVVVQRVLRLLDEPEDVVPGRIALAGMTGKIRFDQVTFRYPGQVDPAVDDLSLKIEPGQKVALMGPSGSGKTTVFSLLLRFYDPQEGKVRVGGVDLTEADPGSVRRHVCMVQQEPIVFSGTLADNIIYGRLDATPKMVMEAAQRAELHEFVMTLPIKYETEVGENGITLSGGQKQRLALATALLTDPEILLLDDTTSALDAATEARIRGTLNQVLEGRTSLIITQRIATARDCDRIIVLENGRISQDGTHEELRGAAGFYHRICRQQEAL